MIKDRIKKFWLELKQNSTKTKAFLVTNPRNIFYLSQFKGEGILLLTTLQNYLITDSRYTEQAEEEAQHCKIIVQALKKSDAQTASLADLVTELKIKELGFESDFLKVNAYLRYQQLMPQIKLAPFNNIVETIRTVKDPSEIELLNKAAQIADRSFREIIKNINVGISEIALANELNYNMRKNGAEKEAFDIIVTAGERGTLIHGAPSNKRIMKGELIIIDFGAVFDRYHSDCTRTLLMGKPNKEQEQIYNLVKEVQAEILQLVKPGMQCSELDKHARLRFAEKGFEEYFQHSLGHGVGLDIHELPRLSYYNDAILKPGMVIAIEPGLYIPGVGGVRIEDTVVVTENGCDILTSLPKELSLSF